MRVLSQTLYFTLLCVLLLTQHTINAQDVRVQIVSGKLQVTDIGNASNSLMSIEAGIGGTLRIADQGITFLEAVGPGLTQVTPNIVDVNPSAFTNGILVNGGEGTDIVVYAVSLSMSNQDFEIQNFDQITVFGPIQSQAGHISLQAHKSIQFSSTGNLSTQTGNINLTANMQNPRNGDFNGIVMDGNNITTTHGNIEIKGRGGNSGQESFGIKLQNQATINGHTLLLDGNGRLNTTHSRGVSLTDAEINTTTSIIIQGLVTSGGVNSNYGIWLKNSMLTSDRIHLTGTLDVNSGTLNYGVQLDQSNLFCTGLFSTPEDEIRIIGNAGANRFGHGVSLKNQTVLDGDTFANISLTGFGSEIGGDGLTITSNTEIKNGRTTVLKGHAQGQGNGTGLKISNGALLFGHVALLKIEGVTQSQSPIDFGLEITDPQTLLQANFSSKLELMGNNVASNTGHSLKILDAQIQGTANNVIEIATRANALNTNPALLLDNTTIGGPQYTGRLKIITDRMGLTNSNFQTNGQATLQIEPFTPETSIGFGSANGTLQIPALLATSIIGGFSSTTIGNTNTGKITVGQVLYPFVLKLQASEVSINQLKTGSHALTISANSNKGIYESTNSSPPQIESPQVQINGRVSPNTNINTGILSVKGHLILNGNSDTFFVNIQNATTAGQGYDQLEIKGGANTAFLGGALLKLEVDPNYIPAVGHEFILINNMGLHALNGQFKDLPEGAIILINGFDFALTYTGGNGNDLALHAIGPRPADTEVVLNSNGTLQISDVQGGSSNDNLKITKTATHLQIKDPNLILSGSGVGVTQINFNTVQVPIDQITNGIFINCEQGDDTVTWDANLNLSATSGGVTIENTSRIFHKKPLVTSSGAITYKAREIIQVTNNIHTNSGHINIAANANGSIPTQAYLSITSNSTIKTINGNINLYGSSGSLASTEPVNPNRSGLFIQGGKIQTTDGEIALKGKGNFNGSNGIFFNTDPFTPLIMIEVLGNGSITIEGDALGIDINGIPHLGGTQASGPITIITDDALKRIENTNGNTTIQSSGVLTIKNRTPGKRINIGQNYTSQLAINNTFLSSLQNGFSDIKIGDESTGNVQIKNPLILDNLTVTGTSISYDNINLPNQNIHFKATNGVIKEQTNTALLANNFTVNGSLAPGGETQINSMAFQANIILNETSTLALTVNNDLQAGVDYDQIELIQGSLNLNNAALVLSGGFTPNNSQEIILVNNHTNFPIQGAFSGFPQGSLVTIGDYSGIIQYNGGDGNDITLLHDNTPPSAVCQNKTIYLNANGEATLTAEDIDGGSTDNIAIATKTLDKTMFNCDDIGIPQIVTLTITDTSGLSSQCTATVTIEDNLPPNIVCPSDILLISDTNSCGSIATYTLNPSDNCNTFTIQQTEGLPSGSLFPIGVTQNTYLVTDNQGNNISCTFFVTVTDNIPPALSCKEVSLSLDENGQATLTANQVIDNLTDNCDIQTTSLSKTLFDCNDLGTQQVTLTVTDVNGNQSSCNISVNIQDTLVPTVSCKPITLELNTDGEASITFNDLDDGSFDNCGIAFTQIQPQSFNCNNLGENTVSVTVIDVAGNTQTCATRVTVVDNTAPDLSCRDLELSLDVNGQAILTIEQIATTHFEACTITSTQIQPNTFSCNDIGKTIPVQVVTQDSSGNIATCHVSVTITDSLPPSIFPCPKEEIVLIPFGSVFEVPNFWDSLMLEASDNCTSTLSEFTQTPAIGTLLEPGNYPASVQTVDASGNSAVCNFTLVVDTALAAQNSTNQVDEVLVYPNPTNGNITIKATNENPITSIQIYDALGRLIDTHFIPEQQLHTLKLHYLASGLYWLVINQTDGKAIKQVVKE